jgi:hypothetical protein
MTYLVVVVAAVVVVVGVVVVVSLQGQQRLGHGPSEMATSFLRP